MGIFQLGHSFEFTTDPYISVQDDPYITDMQIFSIVGRRYQEYFTDGKKKTTTEFINTTALQKTNQILCDTLHTTLRIF